MTKQENKLKRRPKRTKKELKEVIMSTMERVVTERGFMDIPLLVFVNEAGIDPNVFYRHYGTMDKLIKEFVKEYDFWLSDKLKISDINKLGMEGFYAETLKMLYRELDKNGVMQKLLVWELAEDNQTTRDAANMREKTNINIMAYYSDIFKSSDININAITAILISGIYHLVVRSKRSEFCSIDFTSEDGKKQMNAAIDTIVRMIFGQLELIQKQANMIDMMREDNIPDNKICKYMGITVSKFKKLSKYNSEKNNQR